ncbi:class I SAM-dependent methyltransferase [Allocoleopsis sp.]|uniref:class I SAM-dependent methyltransferase n=1 Tax=Allocoleopsis sp. TaxID=3088169 RepID=UPI002FD04E53
MNQGEKSYSLKFIPLGQFSPYFGDELTTNSCQARSRFINSVSQMEHTYITNETQWKISCKAAKKLMRHKLLVEDAIASLQSLKSTHSEPSTLVKFPGAGVLKEAGIFTADKPAWVVEARETIQTLLTPTQFASLQNVGMLNQHFTNAAIIQEMWQFAFEFTGYRRLKVLDPGCGTSGFYRHCPHPHLIHYVGVELDEVTAQIANKVHYGVDYQIYNKDFLKWDYPVLFDVVIGNVPFVNGVKRVVLDDRKVNLGLHAQFFIKSLRHLAPGGLLLFLTSTNTLDSVGEDYVMFREIMRDRALFLGAVRLPCDGTTHVGGTEVTTDLIILQKR